jgi:hypothetical protein
MLSSCKTVIVSSNLTGASRLKALRSRQIRGQHRARGGSFRPGLCDTRGHKRTEGATRGHRVTRHRGRSNYSPCGTVAVIPELWFGKPPDRSRAAATRSGAGIVAAVSGWPK